MYVSMHACIVCISMDEHVYVCVCVCVCVYVHMCVCSHTVDVLI